MVLLMDNLKSMIRLWITLADEFNVTERDKHTFLQRATGEGENFLCVVLPQLGKDFESTLISGEPLVITSRFKLKPGTKVPLFLNSLFLRVLNGDGTVRCWKDTGTIRAIRQLCLLAYKLERPYNDQMVSAAVRDFIERDAALNQAIDLKGPLVRRARGILGRVLSGLDPVNCIGKNSAGAVAKRTPNYTKWSSFRWDERLNASFPYDKYFFYNESHFCDELQEFLAMPEVVEPCARLVAVPKDSRGPRLICCEPLEHQFIQQGLMQMLYRRVETHPLTRGFVNFTNQQINGDLAEIGSETQLLGTMDLKDASDRVRWDLVQEMFPQEWVNALDACRTRSIDCEGVLIETKKFAPMGSSVCFPVEALVFWALLVSAFNRPVWVYGDDIILETALVERAADVLESYDLKINRAKTCYRTPFRESCGKEFCAGKDVGYVKLRRQYDSTSDMSKISYIQFANEIASSFGDRLGARVRSLVMDLFGPIPTLPIRDPLVFFGSHSAVNDVFFRRRFNRDIQVDEYLLPTVVTPKKVADNTHWAELHRKVAEGQCSNGSPYGGPFDNYGVNMYAVPEHCSIKFRWRRVQ